MRRSVLTAAFTAAAVTLAVDSAAASPKKAPPSLAARCAADDVEACAARAVELAHDEHDVPTARALAQRACTLGSAAACSLRTAMDITPLTGTYTVVDAPLEPGARWGRTTWTFDAGSLAVERTVARMDPTAPTEHVFCSSTVKVNGTWDLEQLHVGGPAHASSSVVEYLATGPVTIPCEVTVEPGVYTLVSDAPLTIRNASTSFVLTPLPEVEIEYAQVLGR